MPVRRLLLAVLVLAVAAAACDSASEESSTTSSSSPVETTATTATTTTTAPEPAGLAVPVVRSPASAEVIYFVMTDRFENGDPGNDLGGDPGGTSEADVLRHGFLPTDTGFYHGGDLAGLEARLDYIAGLGATAIWITPPFTNRTVQGNGTVAGSSAGYHGYWQVDFTTVDPHLGTNDELRSLVAAAHERGLAVFVDAVANHTGDVVTYEEGVFGYVSKEASPFLDAGGTPFDPNEWAGTGEFPELDPAVSFPYTPVFATEEDATIKRPDWLNDPIHYHNRGNSTFSGESSLYGDFYGLDDLFTEHPDVVAGMTDVYRAVITEYGIDGFRVDTVKHVNDEFWDAFVPEILSTGGDEFFLFGEVYGSDPILRSHYSTRLGFPSTLDFGFSDAAIRFVADGGQASDLADMFRNDDWFTDEDSNASMLVKFIGNHDIGRLGRFIVNGNVGADDAELLRRAELAVELMFTTRGIPLVYYGDEQGFVGDSGDQGARQSMFPSLVDSYNDDDLIGTDATTADDNFDPSHPLYASVGELAQLRRDHPALVTGAQIERLAEQGAGVFAFSRIDRDERVEYIVLVNNSEAAREVSLPTATPGTVFTEVYPAEASAATSDAEGGVVVAVPPLSTIVLRAETTVPAPDSVPQVAVASPRDGAEVTFPRFRIEADVTPDVFAEVTFAVSVEGGEWQVLGTDDAPPYRVFWDTTGLDDGTSVDLMVTVDDLTGGRAVATSTFTLGERR